jgi:cytochrome oxidase Cu insertion factor (SCO1/SenC/PrrC family)
LWLIAAVCIAPFAASFVAYYFYQPEGRINYGDLIEGRRLPPVTLRLTDGGDFPLARLEGKWVFITIDDAACDAYCEKKLWQIRQVRKTQGKYPERIERVWLVTGGGKPAQRLGTEYVGTWMIDGRDNAVLDVLPHAGAHADHIYLVDPLGNVILRDPRDADPSRMKKDLERLLKVSRVG